MAERILVVDDDPMIRSVVKEILGAEGYDVVVAEDGPSGIKVLDTAPRPLNFVLIVLDVMMPGMIGLDVLTRIRLNEHTRDIPVIMLTGEDRAEDIMAGYNVGADYYITKPFTRQQLIFGLNSVLGPAR